MRTQAGNGQQKHCQQFAPENTVENSSRVVEVYQNPVYHLKVQVPCGDTRIAVHIDVYYQKKNTHGPSEFHIKTHKDSSNYYYLCIKQIKVKI